MQLTLFVPELVWPDADEAQAFDRLHSPALNTLLGRGQTLRRPPCSLEQALGELFAPGEHCASAPLRLLGENRGETPAPDDATWICADPVHLRLHQNRLILADSGSFSLTLAEARALAATVNEQLPEIGHLHVASAERWYLRLAPSWVDAPFNAPPLSTVAGRGIEQVCLETLQTHALRNLLNQIQMLLHAHPVNARREKNGQLRINSLWLWGVGKLPARRESDFDGVWSSNPLARGLARAAGIPTHPPAQDAATFLAHAAPDTAHLIVCEDLLLPAQHENPVAHHSALMALEQRWFAPLYAELRRGRLRRLQLVAPTGYARLNQQTTSADLYKFWRRPQTLAALAKKLAKGSA